MADLRLLEWMRMGSSEHLLGVFDESVVDFLSDDPGTVVSNGRDRLPNSGAEDCNGAWVEGIFTLGNGIDQNLRYDGLERTAIQLTVADSESLVNSTAADFLMSDVDFTVGALAYLDSVGADRTIISLWDTADVNLQSWRLFYNSASTCFTFAVMTPAGVTASVNTASVVAGVTYFVIGWYDSVADTVNIALGSGGAMGSTVSTALAGGARAIGPTSVALRVGAVTTSGAAAAQWNGRLQSVFFFSGNETGNGDESGVLTTLQRAALYNAGDGRLYSSLTGYEKFYLIEWWDLTEAAGDRLGQHQGVILTEEGTPSTGDALVTIPAIAQAMVPKCDGRPTLTLGSAGACSPQGDISYRVSFINADGRYGEPGPEATITLSTNNKIGLSNLPLCPADQDCIGRAVWRKDSDMLGWQLAFTVMNNTTTSYEDTTVAANLTDDLVEGNSRMPPARYWCEFQDRAVAAHCETSEGDLQTLFISNREEPWYCPLVPDLEDPNQGSRARLQGREAGTITGICTHGGVVAVFTSGAGWLLLGVEPNDFRLQKFCEHGCVAHRTIKSVRNLLIWLGTDGVYAWDGSGAKRISDDQRTTIEGLTADQMAGANAFVFEDKYYLCWDEGLIFYDLEYGVWGTYTNNTWRCTTTALATDSHREKVYAALEGTAQVYQIETGAQDAGTNITAVWESRDWDAGLAGRDKRLHYIFAWFKKTADPATATLILKRGTGEVIQREQVEIGQAHLPDGGVARIRIPCNEYARDENFRLRIEVTGPTSEVILLGAGVEWVLAS